MAKEITLVIGKKHLLGLLALAVLLAFASVLCWAGAVVSIALASRSACAPDPTQLAIIVQTMGAATPPTLSTPLPTKSAPTLFPTPAPTRAASGDCAPFYVVQAGDTLQSIAARCNATAESIASANNLPPNASLKIGQQLVIPQNGRMPTPFLAPPTNTPPAPTIILPTNIPFGGGSPSSSPTPPPAAETTCEVNAWMSEYEPDPNTAVTVSAELVCDGQPIIGAPMKTTWNYKDQPIACDEGITNDEGIASCTLNIGSAESGYYVRVDISLLWQGRTYTFVTGFTPR